MKAICDVCGSVFEGKTIRQVLTGETAPDTRGGLCSLPCTLKWWTRSLHFQCVRCAKPFRSDDPHEHFCEQHRQGLN